MKYVLILLLGLVAGYSFGYSEGAAGKANIAARVVGRVGGKSRAAVGNDIDARMKAAEDTMKAAAKRPPNGGR